MKRILYSLMILSLFAVDFAYAQDWMNGYTYRKKITIDKSKVIPVTANSGSATIKQDHVNFPVLLVLQDDDLIHIPGSCSNKITRMDGKDISFALAASPSVPLNFQLEDYNPETGKLTCWVKIPSLSANGTSSAPTVFYFYYGSALLHDPFGINGTNVWSGEFSRVWHLNQDILPAVCRDAQSGLSSNALNGSSGVMASDFVSAKIGKGIRPHANSYLQAGKDTSASFTISAWINIQATETDQVIIANDSTDGTFRNGYTFKIDPLGGLVLEFYRSRTVSRIEVPLVITGSAWQLISITISGTQLSVLVNGIQKTSINSLKMGAGGSVRVGMSKQNTAHYHGMIDEIRIQKSVKKPEWFRTQYINQDNPLEFYIISEEEYNPAVFARFTGIVNNLWNIPANWAQGNVPVPGSSIIIPENRTITTGTDELLLHKLILKNGANLYLNGNLVVDCDTKIETGGQIKLSDQTKLKFRGDVINNGNILSNPASGTLSFSGNTNLQIVSGNGTIRVHQLENEQISTDKQLILNSGVQVSGYVQLKRGGLNANGNLTLLASPDYGTATLLPVRTDESHIYGTVHVQQYIAGGFSPPATARNWRLLASPVYNSLNSSIKEYNFSAYKHSMFITGPGGIINGFDPSPLNSGTIYIHDQSLKGNLSQKYTAINDMQVNIPMGKGVYIFSRGSRNIANAYLTQIEQKPFTNPDGYYIVHSGEILTGDLQVDLSNRNLHEAGDGFNLLGNPYPASLQWGSLSKTNLSPFIWQYDPVNKDYLVNDASDVSIPAGTAFFVKVKNGETSGKLIFTEYAKLQGGNSRPATYQVTSGKSERNSIIINNTAGKPEPECSLRIILSKGQFTQQYKVNFRSGKNDGIDDNDALKIAEGFVNICSTVKGVKIAVEERDFPKKTEILKLHTSVWADGEYQMDISMSHQFSKLMNISIADSLKQETRLIESGTTHTFALFKDNGGNRFSVIITPRLDTLTSKKQEKGILVYPNPVTDRVFLRSQLMKPIKGQIVITDLSGKVIYSQSTTINSIESSVDCSGLKKGIYFISIYSVDKSNPLKSTKIIKL